MEDDLQKNEKIIFLKLEWRPHIKMEDDLNKKMEDDLNKKMEDDLQKMEDDLKNGRQTQ